MTLEEFMFDVNEKKRQEALSVIESYYVPMAREYLALPADKRDDPDLRKRYKELWYVMKYLKNEKRFAYGWRMAKEFIDGSRADGWEKSVKKLAIDIIYYYELWEDQNYGIQLV